MMKNVSRSKNRAKGIFFKSNNTWRNSIPSSVFGLVPENGDDAK